MDFPSATCAPFLFIRPGTLASGSYVIILKFPHPFLGKLLADRRLELLALRSMPSLNSFKQVFKTHLFNLHYN